MVNMLTISSLVLALGALGCGSGCGSGNEKRPTTTATTTTATTAKTTTAKTTTAKTTKTPAVANTTTAPGALGVIQRWAKHSNEAKWDQLAALYAADAVVIPAGSGMTLKGAKPIVEFFRSFRAAFPDLKAWASHVFLTGNTVASIAMFKGTNTESMMGMKATKKEVSFMSLQVAEIKAGKIVKQTLYADNFNFMGQMGMKPGSYRPVWVGQIPTLETIKTSGTATEKTNKAVVEKLAAHFNAHEAKKLVTLYTQNAWFDDQSAPKRTGGTGEILKEYQSTFRLLPDVKLENTETWAAGDYVITTYVFTGTSAKTQKQVKIPAASVLKLKNGKVELHMVFIDGLAMANQLGLMKAPVPVP